MTSNGQEPAPQRTGIGRRDRASLSIAAALLVEVPWYPSIQLVHTDPWGTVDAPREIVVATTMTTADLVNERVCLDQGGPHVLEAEAASENAATGFLTVDDGSADGEYVTLSDAVGWPASTDS